jgi:hypothetical protein
MNGCDIWAGEFGGNAVFYRPVDIQKIMVSGDRRVIEEGG